MSFPLNPAQREAVRYLDGPLLVLAGAGSGKTRVIAAKIDHLLERGFDPKGITAITFTNKAAREMRERVAELLTRARPARAGERPDDLHVPRAGPEDHPRRCRGAGTEAVVLDPRPRRHRADRRRARPVDGPGAARAAQWTISKWKNALVPPRAAQDLAQNDEELIAARAYLRYDDTLRAYQAVDFDDLIALPVALLASREATAAKWQERCAQLLVDEYQDTNPAQYRLLRLLTGAQAAFTAVGDDDQGDLRLAGSVARQPCAAAGRLPCAEGDQARAELPVDRADPPVGQRADRQQPEVVRERLWSELGHGDVIRVAPAADDEAEAEGVVRRLLAHRFEHRGRHADYAILYRGNHQAKLFEQQLRAQNVPYVISGGQSYFERTEIKDLVAYLRLIANDDDDPAFIPRRLHAEARIGATTLEKLGAVGGARHESLFAAVFAPELATVVAARQREILDAFWRADQRPPVPRGARAGGPLLDELVAAIGYDDYLVASCDRKEAENRAKSVRDFVAWLAKRGEDDRQDPARAHADDRAHHDARGQGGRGGRCRPPFHAARGEGARVSARVSRRARGGHPAASRGRGAGQRRGGAAPDVRRDHARAAQLHLSYCRRRKRAGEWSECEPSRFLRELAQEDVRWAGNRCRPPRRAARRPRAASA